MFRYYFEGQRLAPMVFMGHPDGRRIILRPKHKQKEIQPIEERYNRQEMEKQRLENEKIEGEGLMLNINGPDFFRTAGRI